MLTFLRKHIAVRLAAIWLVVAVPLSLVLLVSYLAWYQSQVSLALQERQGYADSVAASFDLLLTQMRLNMRMSGADLGNTLSSGGDPRREAERLAAFYPVSYVAYASEKGVVITSSKAGLVGSSLATDTAFLEALGSTDGGGLEPSEVAATGTVGFHVAQRIPATGDRPPAVMLMFVDVRRLHTEFPVRVPYGGISVVDKAGQVVYQNEDPRLAAERSQWGAAYPLVRSALRGHTATTRDFRFPGGETRLAVFVPIEPIGWAAGSSIPPAVALASFYRTLDVLFPVGAVLAALALLASIMLSRGIHRSLDELEADARRIGSGDLGREVRVHRSDEIGAVERSLEAARLELKAAREQAAHELETTQVLLETAGALSTRTRLEDVLDELAVRLLRSGGHRRVNINLWDEAREEATTVVSVGDRPTPTGIVVPIFRLSPLTGRVYESRKTFVGDYEALPASQRGQADEAEARRVLFVPMIYRERLVGAISLDDPGERGEFTERQIRIAEGIASQAAVAIENARLLESERDARQQANRELETTSQLLTAARALASLLELSPLLDRIVQSILHAAGRGRVILNLWDPGRTAIVVAASAGTEKAPTGRRFEFAQLGPSTKAALREQRTVVVDYDAILDPKLKRYPLELHMRQALVVPLIERGDLVGFVSLDDPGERHEFTDREKEVVEGIAAQAATAIQNARLLEAERERARLGNSMIAINTALASSLDVDETLPEVLKETCAELGCLGMAVADRVEGGWRIRQAVGSAASPFEPGFFAPDDRSPSSAEVRRTKQPYLCPECTSAEDTTLGLARSVGYHGYALYPLIVRGEVTGVLAVLFGEPRSLTDEELDYLRRVAFAISLSEESSRLYEAEHRVAETLQTALLALPERIRGIRFAHLYHSATETARVGGDFYDLFELEHGLIGITVGDISGHGVDAAVLTSLVKNAIRVQATQQTKSPAEVMAGASELMYANSATEIFATVFFGVLHLDNGLLEYCSAGHTTGACVRTSGEVVRLPGNSPLIGAFEYEPFELSSETVGPGDLLFLYTDGLTEARRDHELFGEQRLFELLASEHGDGPQATLQRVADRVLAFAGGKLSDDLAVLVVERARRRGK